MDSDRGFVLQILHPNTVRVIQVFETFECFSSLSFVVESMTHAGIEVEIDGFAQITTPQLAAPRKRASREDTLSMAARRACLTSSMALVSRTWAAKHDRLGRVRSNRSGDVVLMSQCECEFCFHGIDHQETKRCFPF